MSGNCPQKITEVLSMLMLSTASPDLRWFGFMLSQFDIVSDKNIPTAALTCDPARIVPRIHYNPDFADKQSYGECAAVLMHELWHFLNQSIARQMLRDEEKWNFATDGVINWHVERDFANMKLNQDKFFLPENCIRLPEEEYINSPEDIYAEKIYARAEKQGSKGGEPDPLQKLFDQFQNGEVTLVDDHSMLDQLDKVPEELLKNQIGNMINSASRGAGITPGSMSRILDSLFESVVPWTTLLRNFEGQYLKISRRPSWQRPNRRHEGQQGHAIKRGGKLVLLIDVSGSTSQDMPRFWGEAVALASKHETWVIQCDAAVQGKPERMNKHKVPEVRGGGGTDMNPGLALAASMRPDMLIVFTDGELFNTPIDTGFPELWVVCKTGRLLPNKRCIQIND